MNFELMAGGEVGFARKYKSFIEDANAKKLAVFEYLVVLSQLKAQQDVFEVLKDVTRKQNRSFPYFLLPDDTEATRKQVSKCIDSEYWRKIFKEIDLIQYLPAKNREEWRVAMEDWDVPEFNEENIKHTFLGLFKQLPDLYGERVLGIYNRLSREHLTNNPEGFGKRQIISVGYPDTFCMRYSDYSLATLTDLFNTISQVFQHDERVTEYGCRDMLDYIRHSNTYGEWVAFGEMMRVRLYKKGTLHIEFPEVVSDRLNSILAYACKDQLPSSEKDFYKKKDERHKDRRPTKSYSKEKVVLNYSTIQYLSKISSESYSKPLNSVILKGDETKQIHQILEAMGGVVTDGVVQFPYDIKPVIAWIKENPILPSYESFQFYPTPQQIVSDMWAYIESVKGSSTVGSVLEPSFGSGFLLKPVFEKTVPNDLFVNDKVNITAIDISPLAVKVAESCGCQSSLLVDFMEYNNESDGFDLIVMNPPYNKSQASKHFSKAKDLLADGGLLMAVLPKSAIDEDCLVINKYENAFENTSITTYLVAYQK